MEKVRNDAQDQKSLIDQIGSLDARIKQLIEEKEVALSKLKTFSLPVGTTFGQHYAVKVSERLTADIIPAKLFQLIPRDQFMKSVKVIKTQAKRFVTDEQLDKCLDEPTKSVVYSFSKKEGA